MIIVNYSKLFAALDRDPLLKLKLVAVIERSPPHGNSDLVALHHHLLIQGLALSATGTSGDCVCPNDGEELDGDDNL